VINLQYGPGYLLRTLFARIEGRNVIGIVSLMLWMSVISGAVPPRIWHRGAFVIPLFVLVQTFTAFRAGGDWMPGWRFMLAVLPLWWLLLVVGWAEVAEWAGRLSLSAHKRAAMMGVGILMGLC